MVIRFTGRIAAALAGTAASLVVLTPPASAQQGVIFVQTAPPANLTIQRVAYHDLNLASRTGEQVLTRRVGRAVEKVCLYDQGRWYGLAEPEYNYCAWESWKRARPQMAGAIYRARLTAYGRGY